MHYQTVCRIFVLGNCLCIRVCAYARNRVNILVSLYAHARIVIREERGVERRKGGLQLALTHLLQKFISTNMSDLSSWHLHSLYQTAAAPGIYAKHGNMTPVMIDTWYKTWRAHMQITSIYSKITNCSYKTAYACTHARNQALGKKPQNYKQITKNSKRVESIVHDNLVKNGNKQSSRDKQELATWKCKYDELNAAVQKLSTETPVWLGCTGCQI